MAARHNQLFVPPIIALTAHRLPLTVLTRYLPYPLNPTGPTHYFPPSCHPNLPNSILPQPWGPPGYNPLPTKRRGAGYEDSVQNTTLYGDGFVSTHHLRQSLHMFRSVALGAANSLRGRDMPPRTARHYTHQWDRVRFPVAPCLFSVL
ncbi:hypothetical protein Bbelb_408100 [Branchiostoma belcheri]|nr:hypothetical protein Bbelb_408100 [Branchiostoma belcheri]